MDAFFSKVCSEALTSKAESKPEGKIDTVVKSEIKAEPPLAEYRNLRGRPYTVDYLKVNGWNPKTPIPHVIEGVDAIEKYVMGEIKDKNLMPTISSYKEIMDKVKSYLGHSDNENPDHFLERVSKYIELMTKQKTYENKIKFLRKKIDEAIHD
jgi:hypothetical protein